jgi:hypothetical protein
MQHSRILIASISCEVAGCRIDRNNGVLEDLRCFKSSAGKFERRDQRLLNKFFVRKSAHLLDGIAEERIGFV